MDCSYCERKIECEEIQEGIKCRLNLGLDANWLQEKFLKVCRECMQVPSLHQGRFPKRSKSPRPYEIEKAFQRIQITSIILKGRHLLKGRKREVVDLFYNEALTGRGIAKKLRMCRGSVRAYLKRAYKKISKNLEKK